MIRWMLRGVVVLLFLTVGCRGSGPKHREPVVAHRASVLLVTIDTLRADRARASGPMPRLMQAAASGITCTRAHAEVPLTLPSHATLLSGRGPLRHGVRDNVGQALPPSVPTLSQSLSAAGYATGAFVGGYPLNAEFGLSRGFDHYDDRMTHTPPRAAAGHTERRAMDVIESALAWLPTVGKRPFFLWVHLYDPHEPYDAPPPWAGSQPTPYDDEVAYADAALGKLLEGVEAFLHGRSLWTIITADHGESLGEHGEATHGVFLYESTLHVPLVILAPGGSEPRQLDAAIDLADIAPTLLDALGLEALAGADGRSFLATLMARDVQVRPRVTYIESIHGRRRYGWSPLYGLLDWPWKYIDAPQPELYDLSRDPAEQDNLHETRRAKTMASSLREMRSVSFDGVDEVGSAEAPAVDWERLAGLGYIGGSVAATVKATVDDRPRPDPKDRVSALAAVERGLLALAAEDDEKARLELEAALAADPENLVALNNLGILALRSGNPQQAERTLRRGLRADPTADNIANNLGLALSRLGRHEDAVDCYHIALDSAPAFTAARFNLGLALYRLGRGQEARAELEQVARADPDFPGLRDALAQIGPAAPATRSQQTPR